MGIAWQWRRRPDPDVDWEPLSLRMFRCILLLAWLLNTVSWLHLLLVDSLQCLLGCNQLLLFTVKRRWAKRAPWGGRVLGCSAEATL